MAELHSSKAALRGEPSYVWRAGQERRLADDPAGAGERARGRVWTTAAGWGCTCGRLDAGCARRRWGWISNSSARVRRPELAPQWSAARAKACPFPTDTFDLVLSHEVLEHVQDDRQRDREIVRMLRPGGRLVLFCPNRGYPFETHGIYWRGRYHFGNIPLVNYLPRRWRDRLAPHVRVYTRARPGTALRRAAGALVERTVISSAYDNIIARRPAWARSLRTLTLFLECTPLRGLGLSHFWVVVLRICSAAGAFLPIAGFARLKFHASFENAKRFQNSPLLSSGSRRERFQTLQPSRAEQFLTFNQSSPTAIGMNY